MKYQELGELGKGGMAVVYTARLNKSSPIVALKRPLPWPTCDERLRREIDVLTTLDHPHVMPVLDHGIDDEGKPWYVMPRGRGSLGALWEAGELGDDAEAVCVDVLEEVCAGLGAMHDAHYLHRDVTPRNVIALYDDDLSRGYRWVMADCGLVRRPLGETTAGLTGSASNLGSPGYIAPEGFGNPHDLTEAADVYSLGRVLAWLLTGEKPTLSRPLLPLGPWRPVVRAFTREDPLQRPQSMADALTKALDLLAGLPVSEKADFRAQLREHGGNLRPDNPLWGVAHDHLDDYNFMIDDLIAIEPEAAKKLATANPASAATIAERLGRCVSDVDRFGSRQWDSLNAHLGWIKAVLEGLAEVARYELFEDVALVYCEAVAAWDRYRHNDVLRPWMSRLSGPTGNAMAKAIHQAGVTDYFKTLMERRQFNSPELAALLGD